MRLLLATFTLVLFSSAGAFEKYDLRVLEYSTVRVGEPIKLGIISEGVVLDPELSKKLHEVTVYPSITDEGVVIVPGQELALALRDKLAYQDLQRISLKIPEVVRFKAQHNYLSPQEIRFQIQQKAQSLCTQGELKCEVVFEELKLPALERSGEMLNWKMDLSQLKPSGTFLIPLQVETSKGRSTFWITGKLSLYKDVLVSKRIIHMGEKVKVSDFEMKKMNLSYSKDGNPTLKEIEGHLAKRMIAMGQPLYFSDLKPEPAAVRGQTVKLLVGDDLMEIVSQGTAEESGNLGAMIKVKTQDTKKMMTGILVEKGVVRIQ